MRHSGAKHVKISIEIDATLVRLEVADDGSGFNLDTAPKGLGIDGMRQRAAAIGARLRLVAGERGGTTVICECQQSPAAGTKSE